MPKAPSSSLKIAVFYGSSTCYTEIAAEKIAQALNSSLDTNVPFSIDVLNVANDSIELCENYDYIIMGIPTWDFGELQEDWEAVWPDLDSLNLNNKVVALFGLGDQIGYPQWFLDAMGYLHDKIVSTGARVIGYWSTENYTFEASQALTEDETHFVGLALDEENDFDLSEERIRAWCHQIAADVMANLSTCHGNG